MKERKIRVLLPCILAIFSLHHNVVFASDRLACSSDDGRRKYCDVGGARDADIELSRTLSDAPCDQGSSWGRDDRVWVDRGCRAEFTVYRPEDRYGRAPTDQSRSYGRDSRETCPAGFEPGNHRCSNEERRKGCKDMRMPGGTTCNSHGWGR